MSLSRRLGIFVAFALLALLILAPSEARVRAGAGEPPPNDDFADATVIGELPFSDAINTTGATAEPAEVTSSCVPGGSSEPAIESTVWYRYEVESEIILQVDGIGSDFAPIINAFVETPQGVQMISCVGPFSNEDIHLVLHAEADTALTDMFTSAATLVNLIFDEAMTETAGPPAVTASFRDAWRWMFALSRNKITQTSTTMLLRNNADAATLGTSTVSDDNTTAIRGKFS